MEGYQWGGGGQRMAEKVLGIRNIIGRWNIDRGRLRIVQEMEKPNNFYVWPMGQTKVGGNAGGRGVQGGGE